MSLTEANLKAHQNAVKVLGGSPWTSTGKQTSASMQGTMHTTCRTNRPADSIGSIIGFGSRPGSAAPIDGAASCIGAVSSHAVAVGHGSVRPPPSRATAKSTASGDDIAVESLEAQLEEERQFRRSMETRIASLTNLVERLSSTPPPSTATPFVPPQKRAPSPGLPQRRGSAAMPKGGNRPISGGTNRGSNGKPPIARK